ncbi:MAG: ferritin-like domain-containing protein [Longimicrobiales bacterium]
MDPNDLDMLNFYRASELHGGLVLAHVSRRCRDGELQADLLQHAAEELEHARLWTETILGLGGQPRPTRDTYQTRYARRIGRPIGMLPVLALTQVFERRVYRHFLTHLRHPDAHPLVRATLRRMVDEEVGHLAWVRRWLDAEAERRGDVVTRLLREYTRIDSVVYRELLHEYGGRRRAA